MKQSTLALITLASMSLCGMEEVRLGIFRNRGYPPVTLKFKHPTTEIEGRCVIKSKADTVHKFQFLRYWEPMPNKVGYYQTKVRLIEGGELLFEGTLQTPPLTQDRLLIEINDDNIVKVIDLVNSTKP